MPRALTVCSVAGCPEQTDGRYCPTHRRTADRLRGSKAARGYGAAHRARRRAWAPKVARGGVACARCGQPIDPGDPWDLGHTDDRTGWTGPEHATCNRSAGGRAAHGA